MTTLLYIALGLIALVALFYAFVSVLIIGNFKGLWHRIHQWLDIKEDVESCIKCRVRPQ